MIFYNLFYDFISNLFVKNLVNRFRKKYFGENVENLSEFLVKKSNKIIFTNRLKWYIIIAVT